MPEGRFEVLSLGIMVFQARPPDLLLRRGEGLKRGQK
jgi:hypothetical protein